MFLKPDKLDQLWLDRLGQVPTVVGDLDKKQTLHIQTSEPQIGFAVFFLHGPCPLLTRVGLAALRRYVSADRSQFECGWTVLGLALTPGGGHLTGENVHLGAADSLFAKAAENYFYGTLGEAADFDSEVRTVWRTKSGRPNWAFEIVTSSGPKWIKVPHRGKAGKGAGTAAE